MQTFSKVICYLVAVMLYLIDWEFSENVHVLYNRSFVKCIEAAHIINLMFVNIHFYVVFVKTPYLSISFVGLCNIVMNGT